MPKLEGPPTTPMNNIEITQSGINKLLSELNVDKAPGTWRAPKFTPQKCCQGDISFFLTDIFEHSIRTGKLPDEWVEANVAPVFKKGDRHTASNYRPISLTCVCAKLLEHIICKNIMTNFTKKQNFNFCATRFPCRALLWKPITTDHRRSGSKLRGQNSNWFNCFRF